MNQITSMNYINAPVETVYRALTTQEGLSKTWTKDCAVAHEVGGISTFGFGDEDPTQFKIIELVSNAKIVWLCVESDPEWVGTQVAFELKNNHERTAVTLYHSGWKEATEFFNYCSYNWSFFLYSLKCYCENGLGIPYQNRTF